jgi:hypothetical protein
LKNDDQYSFREKVVATVIEDNTSADDKEGAKSVSVCSYLFKYYSQLSKLFDQVSPAAELSRESKEDGKEVMCI